MSGRESERKPQGDGKAAARIDSGAAVSFIIPLRTGLGLNSREHWRVRQRRVKAERMLTSLAARTHRLPDCRLGLVVVTLVRLSPGTRPMDSDNLPGAMKALRDQLAAEMLIDDADPRVEWRYGQERAKKHAVRVEMAQRRTGA